jgi:uncharacterized Tic20 family protein
VTTFGVPIYSVFLPLIVWAVSTPSPFRRAHARQAFSFQCVFLVLSVIAVGLLIVGVLSPLKANTKANNTVPTRRRFLHAVPPTRVSSGQGL